MANLNKDIIGGMLIPIPPISIQLNFSKQLKTLEQIQKVSDKALFELDNLFASLQHRAFRGEL